MPNKPLHLTDLHDSRLKYLYLSHEKGSMRAAGEELGLAASSISRQIAKLEAELGIELVKPGSHRIRLTEAGELLIDYYLTRLSHQSKLMADIANLRKQKLNTAVIAIGEGLLGQRAIHSLQAFLSTHQDFKAEIVSAPSGDILRMIGNDAADLAVIFSPDSTAALSRLFTFKQPLRVIVHRDAPLANRSTFSLDEIADQALVLPGPRFRARQLLDQACQARSLRFEPALTANSLALILDFVRAGTGATLLPESTVVDELKNGTFKAIPVDCPELNDTEIQVVTRRARALPPIVRELAAELAKAIRMQ